MNENSLTIQQSKLMYRHFRMIGQKFSNSESFTNEIMTKYQSYYDKLNENAFFDYEKARNLRNIYKNDPNFRDFFSVLKKLHLDEVRGRNKS